VLPIEPGWGPIINFLGKGWRTIFGRAGLFVKYQRYYGLAFICRATRLPSRIIGHLELGCLHGFAPPKMQG
jgi:hypothetical protein